MTKEAAVVYQCTQPAYQKWVTQFPSLQAAILEGAAANGAKLIVGENLYMYGDINGRTFTEDLPYAVTTRKGKLRGEMAKALLEAHRLGKVRVAMGRGAGLARAQPARPDSTRAGDLVLQGSRP